MNNWRKVALLSTIGATALVMTACNDANEDNKKEVKIAQEEPTGMSIKPSDKENTIEVDLDKSVTSEPKTEEKKPKEEPEKAISYAPVKETVDYTLLEMKNTKSFKVEAHTGWEESPDKSKKATVDGRGEYSIEEGYGTLVIREGDSDRLITLADKESQHTIKSAEWIDNDRLFIIVGMSYGTVSKGGQLYEVNLLDNSAKKVFPNLTEKEEITSILNNGNGTFAYSIHTYTDDNFNEGYTEQKGLSPNF